MGFTPSDAKLVCLNKLRSLHSNSSVIQYLFSDANVITCHVNSAIERKSLSTPRIKIQNNTIRAWSILYRYWPDFHGHYGHWQDCPKWFVCIYFEIQPLLMMTRVVANHFLTCVIWEAKCKEGCSRSNYAFSGKLQTGKTGRRSL
jgi:hypothetical protein